MASSDRDSHEGERTRGPGRWLRQARERRRLGVPEVAGALHLERRTLEALEADDYGALPPATFVRGYLRAYARYLDLPEEEALQAFDRLGLNKRRPLSPVGTLDRRRGAGSGAGVPLLLGTLMVMVAVGAWLIWKGQIPLPELPFDSAPPAVADVVPEQTVPPAVPAPVEPAVAAVAPERDTMSGVARAGTPQPNPAGEPAAESDVAPTAAVALAVELPSGIADEPLFEIADVPPVADLRAEPAPDRTEIAAAVADTAAGIAGGDADEPLSRTERSAAAIATRGPEPAAEPAPATFSEPLETLSFTFTGESWMEVVDARGERLLFGLVSEPGEREVRGVPPFQVVIGNVGRVSMRHGGDTVALDPYTRGRVARFTLEATDVAAR